MTILQSVVLGIVQGLTEFVPVSSSGHLVIVPMLLGWKFPAQEAFIFDVLVQLGTLIAVVAYFWRDLTDILKAFLLAIWQRQPFATYEARLGWILILATFPAGLLGLAVKDTVEAAFNSPAAAAGFLLVTAILLVFAELAGKRTRGLEDLTWKDALVVGGFQALSIFPGVSRSGSTIAGGMARKMDRPAAARFSFLMAVPVMLAAGGLATLDLLKTPHLRDYLPSLFFGFITSAVVGYLAIRWLLHFLGRRPLFIFAVYCFLLGMGVLLGGCASPPAATPPPTPQPVQVAFTSELKPIVQALHICAVAQPEVALYVHEIPDPSAKGSKMELVFQLGESSGIFPASDSGYAAPLAEEQVLVVINQSNPLSELSREDLQALYNGRTTNWNQLRGHDQEVQAWVYPVGNSVRSIFDRSILGEGRVTTLAMLAPDPAAMLEAISREPGALGYLPSAWLKSEKATASPAVKVVKLQQDLIEEFSQPVLAMSASEPVGAVRELLACLQSGQGGKNIQEMYEAWKG